MLDLLGEFIATCEVNFSPHFLLEVLYGLLLDGLLAPLGSKGYVRRRRFSSI
jgi:hypothetical protein